MSKVKAAKTSKGNAGLAALSLSALGVVFGDIGTSPLYTFKTVLALTGAQQNASATLGGVIAYYLDAHHRHQHQIRFLRHAHG